MLPASHSQLSQQYALWDSWGHKPVENHLPRHFDGSHLLPNPEAFSSNVGFASYPHSGLPDAGISEQKVVDSLPCCLPPYTYGLSPMGCQHTENSQGLGAFAPVPGIKADANNSLVSVRKNFLIFDQSENQTRLFVSPLLSSSRDQVLLSQTFYRAYNLYGKEPLHMADEMPYMKPVMHDLLADKSMSILGSERCEDTEEINALLYSEDSYEDDDDSDDEVTSTYRLSSPNEGHNDLKHLEELKEAVASSGGSTKRQKVLNGGYKKSSLVDTGSSIELARSSKNDNDVESSCAECNVLNKDINSFITTRKRKAKIRETLRILETIIPGVETEDPLSIIDEAINYLKYLKLKAKALGMSYT